MKKLLLTKAKWLGKLMCGLMVLTSILGAGQKAFALTAPTNLYLVGEASGTDWNPSKGIPFQKSGNIFTLTGIQITGGFAFLPSTSNWDGQYGPSTNQTSVSAGTAYSFGAYGSNSWKISQSGVYDISVNFDTAKMTLTASNQKAPAVKSVALLGSTYGYDNGFALSQDQSNEYIWKGTSVNITAGTDYFRFKLDGSQYGASNGNNPPASLTTSNTLTAGQNCYTIPAGVYDFTVDTEKLTFTVTKSTVKVYPTSMYVIGNVEGTNGTNWDPSIGIKLTSADGGKTFDGEGTLTQGQSYFGFCEKLGANSGDWNSLGMRFQPGKDATGNDKNVTITSGGVNELTLGSDGSWTIAGGKYNFHVDYENMQFTVTAVSSLPTALNLLGQFNDNGSVSEDWNTGKTMTAGADNKTFTILDVKMMGKDGSTDAYFRFKTGDGLQYGPETEVEASLTAANPLVMTSDKAYYLKNGTYSFTVNVEDWTFTVTGTPDVTTPTNPDVYIAGSFNGWGDAIGNEEYKFVDEGDQIYTGSFNVPKGSSFQIVVGSTWYGSKEGEGNVTLDASQSEVELDLATGYENNFVLTNWPGGNIDFTVTLEDMLVVLEYEFPEVEEKPTLYVVGDDINGSELWAVGTDNVMTYNEADGTYTWSGTKLGGKFKIFDGDWNGDYNIGAPANAAAIELGTPFTVQKGNYPENIFLAENTYIENPEIVLDLEKLTITLTGTVVSTAPYVPDYITLKGSFDEWGDGVKLEKTEDGTYVGIGVIPASTDEYKYVELKLDAGNNQWYGPADNQYDITLTSDEPTTVDMNVKAEGNWYLQNWTEEGEITFTVDWDAKTLTLLYEAKVADVWYIRGKFNDYNPADNSEWALNPVEDENGVYTGTFTVDSGEFSFNFLSPYGYVFIPGTGVTVEIEFTNGKYNGSMSEADETEESVYWEFPDWTGGEFTVTVDLNEASITIETDAEHDTDAVNALYRFTEDDAIYNLQGVKVSNPVKGQIYIINGKKVVLK